VLRDPLYWRLNTSPIPSTSPSLDYFNVYTLNSQNPVNILNGTIVPWQNTGGINPALAFIDSVVSAINNASASTLYWAQRDKTIPYIGVWAHPCVKFSVLAVGNTGDILQDISISYLDNGTNVSEDEFSLLPASGVQQTAGMTTQTFATAIANAMNSFCSTQNTTTGSTTSSDTITFTTTPTARFVAGNCVTGNGLYITDITPGKFGPVFVGSVIGNTVKLVDKSGNPALVSVPSGTVVTASIVQTLNGAIAIASGSDVIIRPQYFVKSLTFKRSSARLQFSYVLPDYPTSLQLNPEFVGGEILRQVAPTVPSVPTTGVISGINLTEVGSGAAVNVSVNSITNVVNGLNVTSIGSGYQYPPRIKISSPNTASPTIQVVSFVSGQTTKIDTINVTATSGLVTELLKGVSITNISSTVDAATKIVDGINAKTLLTGYSSAISQQSNDTVELYAPTGSSVKQISISRTGVEFNFTIPNQALASLSVTTSNVTGYTVEQPGSGYTTAPVVNIKGGGGSGATAVAVIDENGIGAINVTSGGTGYPSNLNAVITDTAGSGSGATVSVTVASGVITNVTVLTPGKGYIQPAITYINPSGPEMGNGAFVTFSKTGVLTNVNTVTEGTGYTFLPTVTVQPSTGIFVQFSSTGTLPSPIVQGNTYRAENPSSGSTFTLKNNDFSDVNITSTGSGTVYLVLSRAFSIGFTGKWSGDFTGITDVLNQIKLQTDYQLPITSPSTDTFTYYKLTKETNTKALIYKEVGLNNVQVVPTQLGVGQSYYALPNQVTVNVYNNRVVPSSTEYLTSGMTVQFSSSSGTLPSPLVAGTDYKIYPSGDFVTVKTVGGSSIVFTTLGNSQLYMNIIRQFTPKPATTVILDNCIFETGDKITVRSTSGDVLPSPLSSSSTYYASRAGDDLIYICSSSAAAIAKNPIQIFSAGNSVNSSFIIDSIKDPTLVKAIYHVEKPVTLGYISLYAFDYGRSNDMALIGQYHPSEVNPKYRRIRIGKPCAWVRMAYQVRPVDVTSDSDYIPLENERAVLTALHAVDLEDKDFLEQAQKYWATAITYLRQETESLGGHAMVAPQINNITYGDGTDPIVN